MKDRHTDIHIGRHIDRHVVGSDCALVESMPFDRGSRVRSPRCSPGRDLGQVLHLQLPVALRRVNSGTVSIAVVGSASESLMHAVRSAMGCLNTIQCSVSKVAEKH